MTKKEIEKILGSQSRVYNSENELVLHFAIDLILQHKISIENIYFERCFSVEFVTRSNGKTKNKESYIDLVTLMDKKRIGFEFKYCTRELNFKDYNEIDIKLKNQSGNDAIRFGFRKDIYRLETLIKERELDLGFAILLTNDKNLFKSYPAENKFLDKNYRFTNLILKEDLGWYNNGTPDKHWTKNEKNDVILDLSKPYAINWEKGSHTNDSFHFCVVEIN